MCVFVCPLQNASKLKWRQKRTNGTHTHTYTHTLHNNYAWHTYTNKCSKWLNLKESRIHHVKTHTHTYTHTHKQSGLSWLHKQCVVLQHGFPFNEEFPDAPAETESFVSHGNWAWQYARWKDFGYVTKPNGHMQHLVMFLISGLVVRWWTLIVMCFSMREYRNRWVSERKRERERERGKKCKMSERL